MSLVCRFVDINGICFVYVVFYGSVWCENVDLGGVRENSLRVAKVEVAGSSPVTRSILKKSHNHAVCGAFFFGKMALIFG